MIVLGVDTSTEFLTVSVINAGKTLADYNAVGKLNHSALLVPTIKKALKKAKKRLKDIGLFAIGVGPGSFTGLRVGMAAVRALAITLDKPIVGVPTLDAIAYNALGSDSDRRSLHNEGLTPKTKICPILDAKKSQVYACIYGVDGDKLVRKSDYLLEPVEKLMERLNPSTSLGMVRPFDRLRANTERSRMYSRDGERSRTTGRVLFLGDGIPIYREKLSATKALKVEFIDDKRWFPKASTIAKLGLLMFNSGKHDDPYDLEPMYLYARDCNVRKG